MTRSARIALVLVVAATAVRLALAAMIPLFPDETYYWDWSRHLAAGYFDHPPAIAILIRAGTSLIGATPLGVRLGAILAGIVASVAIIVTSWRLRPDDGDGVSLLSLTVGEAAPRAALLMLVIPAALVGFVMATPDAPLLAALALTIAALERAVSYPARSRASFGWWCAAGVALGLAFSSKYTSVLLPAGVLIALLTRRDLRPRLAAPGPYAAAVISLLVLVPTLLWNSRHGWISFAFQLHHGLGHTHGSALGRELTLIAGQLGLVSPIIGIMAVVAVAVALRAVADPRRFVLAVIAVTVIVFFAVSALRRPVEPNWPIPALVAALPLLATVQLKRRARIWLIVGAALGALCSFVVAAQAVARVISIPPRRDATARAHGWNDLALAVQSAESNSRGCSAIWIAADRYQDASELAFHLPDKPRVFALNLGGRPNQYDLWPSIYKVAAHSDCALVVVDEGSAGESVVRRFGADSAAILVHAVMKWRDVDVARRAVWLVRGMPSAPLMEVQLSPAATAALTLAAKSFAQHAVLLDSVVALYRVGPEPSDVSTSGSGAVANADRRSVIDARIAALERLLQRGGFRSVYRDSRYPRCTFVRVASADSTDIGYVRAAEGCKLATGHGDALLRVAHSLGSWYAYASPSRGTHN